MTLVLSIQTRGSIWLVTDRRLSRVGAQPIDDAVKATVVDVRDGTALIGYAGLGATALGNQPSIWVSNVLRGRHYPLEQTLSVLASAMQREFVPHMNHVKDIRLRQHCFLIPAFLEDQHQIFMIVMGYSDGGYKCHFHKIIAGGKYSSLLIPPPIGLAGSGRTALEKDSDWMRPLLGLVKAYNRRKLSADAVATYLAQIAYRSHLETKDGSVGPDCLVIWRNSRLKPHNGGGGADCYSRGIRVSSKSVPSVWNGTDIAELVRIVAEEMNPHTIDALNALKSGNKAPEFDASKTKLNERTSNMPVLPDEKFR